MEVLLWASSWKKSTNDPNLFTDLFGHKYFFGVRKISGKFQYGVNTARSPVIHTISWILATTLYRITRIPRDISHFCGSSHGKNGWRKFQFHCLIILRIPQNGKQTLFQLGIDAWNRIGYNSYYFGGGYTPTSDMITMNPVCPADSTRPSKSGMHMSGSAQITARNLLSILILIRVTSLGNLLVRDVEFPRQYDTDSVTNLLWNWSTATITIHIISV